MSLSQVNGCLSCQHEVSLERLLPHLSGTIVEAAELAGGRLCIWARARAEAAACPRCGRSSARVHSAYQRRLADAPVGGHRVVIRLAVRRFFCANPDCPAVTFAEQIDGLTARRARRTPPLARLPRATADELLAKTRDGRPSLLDEHKHYLHQRWNEGCTNVRQLHAELRGRGYRGGYGTIRDYVQPFRDLGTAPPAAPAPPKTRDVASWILRDPDHLDDEEKSKLAQIRDRCPDLTPSPGMSPSSPRSSPACTATSSTPGSPPPKPAAGPTCGPSPGASGTTTTPWSTGSPCPGTQVWSKATSTGSRCSNARRTGRASFPLLRKRVLLAT